MKNQIYNEGQYPDPPRCGGKIIYDKRGAITAKNLAFKRGLNRLRIYECDLCDGWHLTHKINYEPHYSGEEE